MNRFLLLCLCLINFYANAQSADADAERLYTIIKKLPSYKDQVKGFKEQQFERTYRQLLKDLPNAKDEFSRFYMLSTLLLPLNDNHLYFYRIPPFDITTAKYKDTAFINSYRASAAYKQQPVANINVDSLYRAMLKVPADSVEGIYHNGNEVTIALYRTAKRDSLVGVVTQSNIPTWAPGQIALVLTEYKPNRFRSYHCHVIQKYWGLVANEKYMHNMLTELRWKKFPDRKDYVNINPKEPVFQFRNISKQMQYLRLGSFATGTTSLAASQDFYNQIKDSLTAPVLIVDLRNNGGGGFKAAGKFFTLLRNYSSEGRILGLINNRTYSNAEQFSIRLKQLKNVTLLGETTNGTLTYGNNMGTTETLPSGIFRLYITDMNDEGGYLGYESAGLKPAVFLNPDNDWIKQAIQYQAEHPVTDNTTSK